MRLALIHIIHGLQMRSDVSYAGACADWGGVLFGFAKGAGARALEHCLDLRSIST